MAKSISDFIITRLSAWGVKRIYGYPGDGINGIMGALREHQDTMDFIQVRHEEMAAFMATGHAKFTGEVGVCLATSGQHLQRRITCESRAAGREIRRLPNCGTHSHDSKKPDRCGTVFDTRDCCRIRNGAIQFSPRPVTRSKGRLVMRLTPRRVLDLTYPLPKDLPLRAWKSQ